MRVQELTPTSTPFERASDRDTRPSSAGHVNVDGRTQRIHSDFAVSPAGQWLHVTGIQFVQADQFASGVGKLFDGVGKLHAVNFRGVDEPLHVLAEAEDRGALLRIVAADTFEDREP